MEDRLVTAIEWSRHGNQWVCCLIYFDEHFSRMRLASGHHLSIKVQPRRYCRGYVRSTHPQHDTRERRREAWKHLVPCPSANEVKRGSQCSLCASLDDRKPCIACTGVRCPASSPTREACHRSVTYVYLASFGLTQVKVGVASEGRIPLRWIEQGANFAKRVLIGNGVEARRFEHVIHRHLEVLPALQTKKKVDTLWDLQMKPEIDRILKTEEEIQSRFPSYPYYPDSVHNLIPLYGLPRIAYRPIEVRIEPNLELAGTIIGVKGALLVTEIQGTLYFLNLKNLIGRRITCEADASSPLQMTLDHL